MQLRQFDKVFMDSFRNKVYLNFEGHFVFLHAILSYFAVISQTNLFSIIK